MFFYNFFLIYENIHWILPKKNVKHQKEVRKRYQNLSEEKKNKNINIFTRGIKIFLEKKNTESENIAVNFINTFLKKKNKNYFGIEEIIKVIKIFKAKK